jgi:hypothetical protein
LLLEALSVFRRISQQHKFAKGHQRHFRCN